MFKTISKTKKIVSSLRRQGSPEYTWGIPAYAGMTFLFILLPFLFSCAGNIPASNVLGAPKSVSIDRTNNRLFVVDSQNNNLSLIDLSTNTIVTGQPLLNSSSSISLPQLPQDIAVVNVGGGVTRIFIIGNGPVPRNRITVLNYDSTNGLQTASFSPIIVGADTSADRSDFLGGLAIDSTNSNVFVSNSSDGIVRAYSITTGAEQTGSPITVNSSPQGMNVNTSTGVNRLFVSSAGGTSISVINTSTLALVGSLNVSIRTSDIASSTNSNGTVLFLISPNSNQASVINYNVTANTGTAIGSAITPPSPGTAVSASTVLTGAVAQVSAANRSDGTIVGVITQSTGDLGFIDVTADLSSYSSGRVSVLSGSGAYGVDLLTDGSGNASTAYFAAVGAGAVSYVNVVTNTFTGQIL